MDGQKKLLVAGALFVVLLGGAIWVVNQREAVCWQQQKQKPTRSKTCALRSGSA